MSEPRYPVAILAGGTATRLRPLTETVPKSLIEVNGEPFIAHQLRLLCRNGFEHVVVCAGHLGEMTRAFVKDGAEFGLRVDFSFDGPSLLGTAGALKKALPLLGAAFFVLYGDSYLLCDYRAVQEAFAKRSSEGLMTVFRNEDRWDRSNVEFSDGRIVAYDKVRRTSRMRHLDYGLGILRPSALDAVPVDLPRDLAEVYRSLLEREELIGFEVTQRFYEIGSFEGLEETRAFLGTSRAPERSLAE